jgi:single-strand DNA-binding protein
MRGVNKVFLLGNLGGDVEMRYGKDGQPIARFSVATGHARKNEDGTWDERTDWHKVKAFGPLAERCSQRLSKGSPVLVDGRLSPHSYEDEAGVRRKIVDVVAWDVVFLHRRQPSITGPESGLDQPALEVSAGDPF